MLVVGVVPSAAATRHRAGVAPAANLGPALTLRSQTPWVTASAPWFSLSLGIGGGTGPVGDLHVELTFYNRVNNASELTQSLSAVPEKSVLTHYDSLVKVGSDGHEAVTCTTVLPNDAAHAPVPAPDTTGVCPDGAPTVTLNCTPGDGSCGDIYPISVALYRQGSNSALARLTTFLTYQEPGIESKTGGVLRVGLVVPLASRTSSTLSSPSAGERSQMEGVVGTLWSHRGTPLTLAASAATVTNLVAGGGKRGRRAVAELAALSSPADGDQLLTQPLVPLNVAALAGAGLGADIGTQMVRGIDLFHQADLHPTAGTWVDTDATFTTANGADLATSMPIVQAKRLVLSDSDLAPAGSDKLTFAQPFTLTLGHGTKVTAAAANSEADSLFTAHPGDPQLAANQLLATLEFIHFENAFATEPRGVVIEPPQFWRPPNGFLSTLLSGMTGNPALAPVSLDQFFAQVPRGGNNEPSSRHLVSGSPPKTQRLTVAMGRRLALARKQLTSFIAAVSGHPPALSIISDLLLTTESQGLGPAQRPAALAVYTRHFAALVGLISLAAQRTITFTSRTAAIPVSVLSSAPFVVTMVVSLESDKFSFPDGRSRKLVLQRPTTPVRFAARSSTSGDHLGVVVTLTTPDGGLVIARTALTVRSTSISIVGVGLTILAALVILLWWARTWRKGRRRRPRGA
jgi:hypothetical protein